MINKIFKTFLIVLLCLLVLSPMLVSAEVNPAEPTASIYLGEPKLQERGGKSYITMDVLISDNTADLFVVSYRVISKDKLAPVNFDNGSFSETVSDNFGEEKLTLNLTDTINPSAITSKNLTGIQVLQDSSSGVTGISTKSGVLGTAWFEAPKDDGTYTFTVENLGCNNVYADDSGKLNVGTYKVNLGKAVSFVVGEAKQSTQMTEICDEHSFTVDDKDGKKCENCDTVRRDDGSLIYPSISVNDSSSHSDSSQSDTSDDIEGGKNPFNKYIFAVLGAVIIAAAVITTVILINKKKK